MVAVERVLQRVHVAVGGQALDRGDLAAVGLGGQQRARLHRLAVEQHGAGAARRRVASHVGAGQPEGLSEEVHEERARLHIGFAWRPVHGDGDMRHGEPSFRTARPVRGRSVAPECSPGLTPIIREPPSAC